jgi:hypothetical protein
MKDALVQYVGFEAKLTLREYTFMVKETGESRQFTFTIDNDDFASHGVRYQDAPQYLRPQIAH